MNEHIVYARLHKRKFRQVLCGHCNTLLSTIEKVTGNGIRVPVNEASDPFGEDGPRIRVIDLKGFKPVGPDAWEMTRHSARAIKHARRKWRNEGVAETAEPKFRRPYLLAHRVPRSPDELPLFPEVNGKIVLPTDTAVRRYPAKAKCQCGYVNILDAERLQVYPFGTGR